MDKCILNGEILIILIFLLTISIPITLLIKNKNKLKIIIILVLFETTSLSLFLQNNSRIMSIFEEKIGLKSTNENFNFIKLATGNELTINFYDNKRIYPVKIIYKNEEINYYIPTYVNGIYKKIN